MHLRAIFLEGYLMLDVHVLTLPGLPEEWIKQRRDSINAAVSAAGFPVYVHEVTGIYGHMGRSRFKGYSQGTQPYVTCVDDDDWVREDAFSCLLPHMEAGVEVITMGEVWVYPDGREVPLKDITHHSVFRRDWLAQHGYSRLRFYPDQYLMSQPARSAHVPECVYYYRIREDSPCNRMRQHHEDVEASERRLISGLRRNKERNRAA